MSATARWIATTLLLAAMLHGAAIWYLPRYATRRAVDAIYARRATWLVNALGHGGLRRAGTDTVIRDNPDTLTSFAVYDVSEGPMRFEAEIPSGGNYWSVSLFAWNTDNFFVLNDRQAGASQVAVVVGADGSRYSPRSGERFVASPSARGILLVRAVVTDRQDAAEVARLATSLRAARLARVTDIRP
jgi:uncharacterized membrane protein